MPLQLVAVVTKLLVSWV